MASLIFAAGILTYDKVKKKREEKREKKRSGYQQRYDDLVRQKSEDEERRKGEPRKEAEVTGSSDEKHARQDSAIESGEAHGRSSVESGRISDELGSDDPRAWVDQVLKERGRYGAGGEEAKETSLV